MNELSLFTGAGGGLLGTYLLGWRHIGYVEIDEYCQRLIAQRIRDGILANAPIFSDIRTFISSGCCKLYRGITDVITGGDPCQANSNAHQHGKTAETLAPEFIEVVRIIRPAIVLRENPAAVRKIAPSTADWFAAQLESLGYTTTLIEVRACCMGADHRRTRLFVYGELQNANGKGLEGHVRTIMENEGKGRHDADSARPDKWSATPRICRSSHGVAARVDRLEAIGNGQVPAVVRAVWEMMKR